VESSSCAQVYIANDDHLQNPIIDIRKALKSAHLVD